jgi:hypothetical protein
VVDQVPRLEAFKAAHPDITIEPPGPGRVLWSARQGAEILCTGFDLRRFLDQLEGTVTE